MAIACFNGAEPSDVDAFEAMRGAGAFADDASAVRAVWRGATGRAACSETAARCGGPDPSFWHEYDTRGMRATCGFAMTLPCSLLFAPVMCCASTVSSRRAAEERVVLTERRAYRTHWEAIDAGTTMPGEWPKYEWELQWRAIDLERLSDARRVEPWCFCLGGHDGFAVHVDDETAKFHNYTVRSAGMIFTPDAHQLTTPRSGLSHGRRTNVRNVELGKKYPARDAFRFSSSSPDEAVAILAEVMRAATPQVMTKAQA